MLHANDLLDQRIIEHGNFVPVYTEGSVSEAVLEIIKIMHVTLEERRLEIHCKSPKLPVLKFDRRRLQ